MGETERILRCAVLEGQLTEVELDAVLSRCRKVDLRGSVGATDFIRQAERIIADRSTKEANDTP